MEATSEGDNVLGLRKKDLSLIRHSLEAGGKLIHQVIDGLKHGTSEVQHLILQQSDVILECRVCRNLFRSLPNYLDHKRFYCRELFPNESLSLLASPFADEVPIIYPEPPDDAKEFVEMSDFMSQLNKNKNFESINTTPGTSPKSKLYVPSLRQSIGGILEKSKTRKPKPHYLKPMKETKVAMQLVPVSTNDANRNKNPSVFASNEKIRAREKVKKLCTGEHRTVDLSLIKLADFSKLLCLKCNYTYKNKKRLTHHIKKFHIKRCHSCKEDEMCVDKTKAENNDYSSNRRSKQSKKFGGKKIDLERFSTKSGHPSLKKFSYLAKKSTLVKNADLKSGWCRICNHSYSGKRGLIFHMFRMHSGSRKIYPCPLCNVKFPSFASALRHTQIVHNCKGKDMKSVVRQLKKSGHVENQQLNNMLEPEVKVEKCDSQFNQVVVEPSLESVSDPVEVKKEYNNNENSADSKDSIENSKFKCQECYQEFGAVRGLHLHMTRKHPDVKNEIKLYYTCHICLLSFFTNFSLNKHLELKHNIHENVQENTTQVESKSDVNVATEQPDAHEGTSEYLVDKNIIIYNNKKYRIPIKYYKTVCKLASFPSLCLECNQKFVDARELIRHIIRLHCTYKNAFPCPFCHLRFISSLAILRHTKVQHSCSVREIAELNRKLQIWEQQKNENTDSKIKKEPEENDVPPEEGHNDETQNEGSFPEALTIHDVTDFQTPRCLQCKKRLSGFQGLAQHISKAHAMLQNKKHKCLKCNESFDKFVSILKHMKTIHKPNILFQRKIATSSEVDESAGTSTLVPSEVVAPQMEEIGLDSCKFKYDGEDASNSQLVMQCADFTKSSCLRCSEIFTGNRSLIAHIYKAHAHHKQTYSCYICLQTFKSYAIASQHTRNSHIYKGSAMMYVKIDSINEETSAEK